MVALGGVARKFYLLKKGNVQVKWLSSKTIKTKFVLFFIFSVFVFLLLSMQNLPTRRSQSKSRSHNAVTVAVAVAVTVCVCERVCVRFLLEGGKRGKAEIQTEHKILTTSASFTCSTNTRHTDARTDENSLLRTHA